MNLNIRNLPILEEETEMVRLFITGSRNCTREMVGYVQVLNNVKEPLRDARLAR